MVGPRLRLAQRAKASLVVAPELLDAMGGSVSLQDLVEMIASAYLASYLSKDLPVVLLSEGILSRLSQDAKTALKVVTLGAREYGRIDYGRSDFYATTVYLGR